MNAENEKKIKHLEFIQLTITRMNVNSFLIKGWLITLVAAIFVLAQKDANISFLYFAPFAAILFWTMDGFFISTERKYRTLYDVVRVLEESAIDFSMDTKNYENNRNVFFMSFLSLTPLLFYPIIFVAAIGMIVLLWMRGRLEGWKAGGMHEGPQVGKPG